MKIGNRLVLCFLALLLIATVFSKMAVKNQASLVEKLTSTKIMSAKKAFDVMLDHDVRIMSSAIMFFSRDAAIKNAFKARDRGALYDATQEVFSDLREKYAVTHLYFIDPEGVCFLRVHAKDIYGDRITRTTFYASKRDGKLVSGFDLGKTVFALRVVAPYYDGDELIGYIEFGEEIDRFVDGLSEDSDNIYYVVANKKNLSREKWASVKKVKGERDNWGDSDEHLFLLSSYPYSNAAIDDSGLKREFIDSSLGGKKDGEGAKIVKFGDEIYAVTKFEINNIEGTNLGGLCALINISDEYGNMKRLGNYLLGMMVFLLVGILVIGMHLSFKISSPIVQLKNEFERVSNGEFDRQINIRSEDEIGVLASSFNKMVRSIGDITVSRDRLSDEVKERLKVEAKITESRDILSEQTAKLHRMLKEAEKSREITISMLDDNNAIREQLEVKVKELNVSQMETRNAYEKLKQAQSQLVQVEKMEAIGQMASGVAHEVKNPLGTILQGINYLEGEVPLKQKSNHEMLNIMKSSLKRADRIIGALLEFSRASKTIVAQEDINALVESSATLVKHKVKLKDIYMKISFAKNLPMVILDRGKIEQVFVNIFTNAIYALGSGGELAVRTYCEKAEDIPEDLMVGTTHEFGKTDKIVMVEVRDNGSGIKEEDLSKIFDPFFTTKGRTEGTGLGLSVTRNIIEMHNGFINVQSTVGKGTKVVVGLKSQERA